MTAKKSMTEVAIEILQNRKDAIPFKELWSEVSKETGLGNDKVASFYSDLSLDGRFISLEGNNWDLKSHRKFSETQIDLSEIEVDDDSEGVVYDDDGNIIDEPEEDY